MKKIILFLSTTIFLFSIFPKFLIKENIIVNANNQRCCATLYGNVEEKIDANYCVVYSSIKKEDKNLDIVKNYVITTFEDLKIQLQTINNPEINLINFYTNKITNNENFNNYCANLKFSIKASNLNILQTYLDILSSNNCEVSYIEYGNTNSKLIYNNMLSQAVFDALDKAKLIMDKEIKIISIEEENSYQSFLLTRESNINNLFTPKKITIKATIKVCIEYI